LYIQTELTALHGRDSLEQTVRAQGDRIARLCDKRDRHRARIEALEEEVDGQRAELRCWRSRDEEGAGRARLAADERRERRAREADGLPPVEGDDEVQASPMPTEGSSSAVRPSEPVW
jgi:hypothetical protein